MIDVDWRFFQQGLVLKHSFKGKKKKKTLKKNLVSTILGLNRYYIFELIKNIKK
jgi:hypothetical protein